MISLCLHGHSDRPWAELEANTARGDHAIDSVASSVRSISTVARSNPVIPQLCSWNHGENRNATHTPLVIYRLNETRAVNKDEIQTSAFALSNFFADRKASTGDILPYGVQAVWKGYDISIRGDVGIGSYAFVIDSGVLETTGDLNINREWSKSWIAGQSPFQDGYGHGTHIAGTIGALANGIGVVGVAPGAEIVSCKVFNSSGRGATASSLIEAINYAVDIINANTLDRSRVVINMSISGSYNSSLDLAIRRAADQGIRFSIAAGNSGNDADGFSPASAGDHPNVYVSSAVDSRYAMPSWSNWDDGKGGDDVDFAAPGVDVLSYYKNGQLASLSGTSMAAPHVSGLLLLNCIEPGEQVQANRAGYTDPFATGAIDRINVLPNPSPSVGSATISVSAGSTIDEGNTLNLNFTSSNLAPGSLVYWSISGAGITTSDFQSLTQLSGDVAVQTNGGSSLSIAMANDLSTEGEETMTIRFFLDSGRLNELASRNILVRDTSKAPLKPTHALTLWGTAANDKITGSSSDDRLAGVSPTGYSPSNLGRNQIDTLTGEDGSDTFILGDQRGIFYDDRTSTSPGSSDYALITDFTSKVDKLQLKRGSYFTNANQGSLSLYHDSNGNGRLDLNGWRRDELIAVLQNSIIFETSDILWI